MYYYGFHIQDSKFKEVHVEIHKYCVIIKKNTFISILIDSETFSPN